MRSGASVRSATIKGGTPDEERRKFAEPRKLTPHWAR